MKKFIPFLCYLFSVGIIASPSFAAQETNVKKWIVGKPDPKGEVTIVTNPLNQFIDKQFHPEQPAGEEQTLYEEAVPVEGTYSQQGEVPSEESASPKNPFKEEKEYYDDHGLYYSPPKKEK